jgi:hypothetical protein
MRITPVCIAAALVLAAACSSDDTSATTGPAPSQPVDVSQLLTEFSAPGLAAATGALPAALPVPVVTLAMTGTGCPYVASSQSFVCAPSTSNGLTFTLTYQLFDAAGKPQSQSDRSTAASMHLLSTVSGTLPVTASSGAASAAGPLTISQRQDMTLGGLLGPAHTLNGTSTSTLSGTFTLGGTSAPISMTATQTFKDVVYPATTTSAPNAPVYPTSGTVTIDFASTGGAGALPGAERLQIQFNGTSTATLTITGGGATQRCTINLATQAPPVCAAG